MTNRKRPDTFVVCRSCGSESVSGSGNCWWNSEKQDWETGDIDNFYCGDCESECGVEDVETIQLCLFAFEPPSKPRWTRTDPEWYDKYLEEREDDE